MASLCIFCGGGGKMTAEHVLPDWLGDIGLPMDPVQPSSRWLNRSPRLLGPPMPPFRTTVRQVCASCNNGWMSRLETVARRVLAPVILGEPQIILEADQPAVAAWTLKTVLVSFWVSPAEHRADGYGVPPSEYAALYGQRELLAPPDDVQMWIGRYSGEERRTVVQGTPMVVRVEGLPEPDGPQGYGMNIALGDLFLQGVRFTTPSLELDLRTVQGLAQIWPVRGPVTWPSGGTVDDETFEAVCKGLNLKTAEPHVLLQHWRVATDLSDSQAEGDTVRLPTPCGRHYVYYPGVLAAEAMRGGFYTFMTACECAKAYLVRTEPDGAHFKAEGSPEAIEARYEALPGDELVIEDERGTFVCKQMSSRAWA